MLPPSLDHQKLLDALHRGGIEAVEKTYPLAYAGLPTTTRVELAGQLRTGGFSSRVIAAVLGVVLQTAARYVELSGVDEPMWLVGADGKTRFNPHGGPRSPAQPPRPPGRPVEPDPDRFMEELEKVRRRSVALVTAGVGIPVQAVPILKRIVGEAEGVDGEL